MGAVVTVSNQIGQSVTLAGEKDVGLSEWPGIFDGAPVEHLFEPSTGSWRGIAPPTQTDVECDVVVRRNPGVWVDSLMRLGTGPLVLSVRRDTGAPRVLPVRLVEVGDVDWHQASPVNAHLAHVPVRFVAPRPLWLLPPVQVSHRSGGWLHIGQVGDMPVWPTIRITGQHRGVSVRLTDQDTAQELPHTPSGWVVQTRPQMVTTGDGGVFPGVVPFWPEPVQGGMIEVIPESPGNDFQVTITHTPEVRKAW